jgi:hypothetical protein
VCGAVNRGGGVCVNVRLLRRGERGVTNSCGRSTLTHHVAQTLGKVVNVNATASTPVEEPSDSIRVELVE